MPSAELISMPTSIKAAKVLFWLLGSLLFVIEACSLAGHVGVIHDGFGIDWRETLTGLVVTVILLVLGLATLVTAIWISSGSRSAWALGIACSSAMAASFVLLLFGALGFGLLMSRSSRRYCGDAGAWRGLHEARKRTVLVVAGIALGLTVPMMLLFGPVAIMERRMRTELRHAHPRDRLRLIVAYRGHGCLDFIGGTSGEVSRCLGPPDEVTAHGEFFYYLTNTNTGATNATCRISFRRDGRVSNLGITR